MWKSARPWSGNLRSTGEPLMTATAPSMPKLWAEDASNGPSPSLFAATLLVACVVHLALILGISFAPPDDNPQKNPDSRQLEVVVLRQAAPSDEKPEIADALAQADRVGGGEEEVQDIEIEPSIELEPQILDPEPVPPPPLPPVQAAPAMPLPPPHPIEQEALTATLEPDLAEPEPVMPKPLLEPLILAPPEPEPEPEPEVVTEPEPEPAPPAVTAAQILASRNMEIAELTARIQHNSIAYANRQRRKAISASTREYKYANYLEAWRRKVERVGNLNYPDEAKRHKMYGNLILHVAVKADGSIEGIRVLRSSGFDVLDKAAIKIVELSAPFAPFPPDIRTETDVLDITRTWQFLRSNRLGWEN